MSKGVANNTTPLVEPDGRGGHVPYVRVDTAAPPTSAAQPAGGDGPQTAARVIDEQLLAEIRETNALLRTLILLLAAVVSP